MTITLEQMYEMQKELDARIIRDKGLEGQDLLPNTVLALQVEIGELANEWRGFKHWSNDREPRTKKEIGKCQECDGTGDENFHTAYAPFESSAACAGLGAKYKNPLLEEYVDCLHFFLSVARQLNVSEIPVFEPRVIEEATTEQFIDLFMMVGEIRGWEEDMTPEEQWEMAFMSFTDLGFRLGFTFDQIAEAYAAKNRVNHDRQQNGY